ncbi:hypothetical protein [Saccharopolyspora phatthalungensis]|uniref:Uncharacterized protein n=1 Tax=Saccharopolyspora phatthalungensis TaxID=664693 RepID=A0A840Q8H8_9PSEU|nr:hypothetical protein [Saccharopolyspora phatthalungensis]MBB5154998.1 hypothetical protein [Saccharopolyspora phatthalungensis]
MSEQPARSLLTDEDLERLGITRDLADYVADLADQHGPLTPEQQDRLVVLLRPDPTEHLARGA